MDARDRPTADDLCEGRSAAVSARNHRAIVISVPVALSFESCDQRSAIAILTIHLRRDGGRARATGKPVDAAAQKLDASGQKIRVVWSIQPDTLLKAIGRISPDEPRIHAYERDVPRIPIRGIPEGHYLRTPSRRRLCPVRHHSHRAGVSDIRGIQTMSRCNCPVICKKCGATGNRTAGWLGRGE